MNAEIGNLGDIDCPICRNKGIVYRLTYGLEIVGSVCPCMVTRDTAQRMRESGIISLLKKYTLDSYSVSEKWQECAKNSAADYAEHPHGWLFIGGQVGSGKTHLCTAVVGALIGKGLSARYMLWKDESTRLKSMINDPEYSKTIDEYKRVDVLYIDDFLKTPGSASPTAGDINLAFELLNHRYYSQKLTVISSEMTINDILAIDQALGSRIYEMASKHCVVISKDDNRNYRMKP